MLLVGSPEAPDERVQAAPGLPQRAGAGSGWVGHPEKGAAMVVDLGLSELIQVPEELQHVGPAAHGEGEWRAVVAEVLAEGVPVSPLLVLVPARRSNNSSTVTVCP